MANSVDLDEVAHYKPFHQDLPYLQIQLFSFLACLDEVQEELFIVLHAVLASALAAAPAALAKCYSFTLKFLRSYSF